MKEQKYERTFYYSKIKKKKSTPLLKKTSKLMRLIFQLSKILTKKFPFLKTNSKKYNKQK
jgi:hypothetical protein